MGPLRMAERGIIQRINQMVVRVEAAVENKETQTTKDNPVLLTVAAVKTLVQEVALDKVQLLGSLGKQPVNFMLEAGVAEVPTMMVLDPAELAAKVEVEMAAQVV